MCTVYCFLLFQRNLCFFFILHFFLFCSSITVDTCLSVSVSATILCCLLSCCSTGVWRHCFSNYIYYYTIIIIIIVILCCCYLLLSYCCYIKPYTFEYAWILWVRKHGQQLLHIILLLHSLTDHSYCFFFCSILSLLILFLFISINIYVCATIMPHTTIRYKNLCCIKLIHLGFVLRLKFHSISVIFSRIRSISTSIQSIFCW